MSGLAVLQGSLLLGSSRRFPLHVGFGLPHPQARSLAFHALMLGDLALCGPCDPAPLEGRALDQRLFWLVGGFVMGCWSFCAISASSAPVRLRP